MSTVQKPQATEVTQTFQSTPNLPWLVSAVPTAETPSVSMPLINPYIFTFDPIQLIVRASVQRWSHRICVTAAEVSLTLCQLLQITYFT